MRKIFLADAHLKEPADANYRALVAFLDTLPPDTDTLFILGDLFEFWVGSPSRTPLRYREIVAALKRAGGRGVRIVYFEGNHDFHLARFFSRELGAEVHAEGALVDVGGEPVYLCHGDQVNRADLKYRTWRLVLHSALAARLLALVPEGFKWKVARRLSLRSGSRHRHRRLRWDYPSLIRSFARRRFASGCRAVVTGHFHIPLLEREGGTLLALGDWISHFSYGQWLDGEFTLERFQEPESPNSSR